MVVDRAKAAVTDIICYNCNGKGHISRNCLMPPTCRTQKICTQAMMPLHDKDELPQQNEVERLREEVQKLQKKLDETQDFVNGED